MTTPSLSPQERARKNYTVTLRALSDAGQVNVARALGLSEGQLSKLKGERLEEFCAVLAQCGLKIIPQSFRCYPKEYVDSLQYLANQATRMPPPDEVGDEMGLY